MSDKCSGKSVGAIIRDGDKILMIDRVKIPFGWACPAGHVDAGERVEEALKREVKEEVGIIEISKYKLLLHEFVEWNNCSRIAEGHDWCVYEVTKYSGELDVNKIESKGWKWVSENNLKNLELEPVWEHWFKKLGIIK